MRRERYHSSILSRVLFAGHLESDETLSRAVHKHWLIGLRMMFWPTLLLAGLWTWLAFIPSRGFFLLVSFVSFAIAIWWLRCFFDYFLDAWLITDQAVIDIAWHGWFHRQSTRVKYSDIEGVSYEIKGVLGTLLRYGTISIEKVSSGSEIELEYVQNPRRVEALILANQETYLHKRNMKDATQIQDLLSTLVANQLHLKQRRGDTEEADPFDEIRRSGTEGAEDAEGSDNE